MIFPITVLGVEYATRERFVLLEAALAPVARASASEGAREDEFHFVHGHGEEIP